MDIKSAPVRATTRKLTSSCSVAATKEFLGISPLSRPDNPLDIIKDAIDDPSYDPSKPYEGRWRWPDGRLATPEEVEEAERYRAAETAMIENMALELRAEIDREILRALAQDA